ncbi:MAG: hypothetical protein K8T91_08330 [Planctomycetes bacterium]|nr:hypothetical protein [Planctomycetota bacterium]
MARRPKTRPSTKGADVPAPAPPEASNQRSTAIPKASRKSRPSSKRAARLWDQWSSILARSMPAG